MTKIDEIIRNLGKEFDETILFKLDNLKDIDSIPFGIKTLDKITGVGGAPRGRITEIYGNESNGKSGLCLALVSEAQKLGLKTAYIDMELSMTKELAQKMNVNLKELLYAQPIAGEEALNLVDKLLDNNIQLIIIDSVSSLVPESELESDFGQQNIGLQARLMSKAMRKLLGNVKRNNAALVFVNQIRADIGKFGFGPKTTTTGGKALRFYSSLRIEIARTSWITKGNEKVGLNIKATIVKNKIARPQLSTEFQFLFDTGFNKLEDEINYMINKGEIKLIGRTFYKNNKEIGNKQKTLEWLTKRRGD